MWTQLQNSVTTTSTQLPAAIETAHNMDTNTHMEITQGKLVHNAYNRGQGKFA